MEIVDDQEVYMFHKYVLLKVSKVVSTGFKAIITGEKTEEEVNCRWDTNDRYFCSRNKQADKLVPSYTAEEARSFLQETNIGLSYDQKTELESIKKT